MLAIRKRSNHHPFEVSLLAATLACGIALTATGERPRSVSTAMPNVVQVTWEGGLMIVGIIGLIGLYWRGRLSTGLALELGAMVLLGTTTAMYGIALFAVLGVAALTTGSFITAVAVASWWRGMQTVQDLRALAQLAERLDVAVPDPTSTGGDGP